MNAESFTIVPMSYERRFAEWGASESTIDIYATREHDARTQQVSDLISRFGLPAARARLHIERSDPLETILRSAAQWEADLIVVGRRARVDSFAAGPRSQNHCDGA